MTKLDDLSVRARKELILTREFTAWSIAQPRADEEFTHTVEYVQHNWLPCTSETATLELARVAEYWVSREGFVYYYQNPYDELFWMTPLVADGKVVDRAVSNSYPVIEHDKIKAKQ